MFASSPGLSHMDHPVYDVWVLDCVGEPLTPEEPEEAPEENTTIEVENPTDETLMENLTNEVNNEETAPETDESISGEETQEETPAEPEPERTLDDIILEQMSQ